MKRIIFTVLLSVASFLAHSQWSWVNPAPVGYNLYDVCFVDQSIGYVVGEKGTVLKTTDCGESWAPLNTGTYRNFNMVTFLNENTGYIVSGKYLMKTTDGGETWTDIETGAEQSFTDMFFTNANKGFLSGAAGSLLKTTDGGLTWSKTLLPGNKYVNSISFPSETTGYLACSMGTVMKTTDGGITWTATVNPNMLEMIDVFFVDYNTGFVAGEQGFSMRTTNGGVTWTTTGSNYHLKDMYFVNGMTGYAISGSALVKTTNAGTTWTPVGMDDIWSFDFINVSTVFGTGSIGRLFKSTDQGVTCQNFNPSVTYDNFNDLHFPTHLVGYAVTWGGEIVKTSDAGLNWSIISSGQFDRISSIWFTDASTGYIVTGTNALKSVDGGLTWTEIALPNQDNYFKEVMFVNQNTGFISGESDGIILRTDDAGNSWETIYESQYSWPRAIHFIDPDTGFVALDHSVMKTFDGGQTWTEYTDFDPNNIFYSIFFVNSRVGYVGSLLAKLYKTTDGGDTWTDLSDSSRYYPVASLFFTSETTGYMSAGNFFQTIDGGITWTLPGYITTNPKIWFTDSQTGYLAGFSGAIMKTTNAGAVPVISLVKPSSQFTLYPNPVTGNFTLSSNKYNGKVRITIYNSSGSLVYDEKYHGNNININTEGLKAGMYMVRINTQFTTEVQKLIKL